MSILPKTVQEFFNTHDGELRRHVGVREKGGLLGRTRGERVPPARTPPCS